MVTKVYGTNVIPSDQITVTSGGTVAVGLAFNRDAGLVGGMDTANGTATEGEVVRVNSVSDAADLFGTNSELYEQTKLALGNGVRELYAVPVEETSTTDNFTAASGTLANAPVFDPNVQYDHTITEDTAGATVNIVYDSPPATPVDADTINLNPNTGEWEADSSDTYDISYTYGDYTSAITAMGTQAPRFVGVCTENASVANELITELETNAQNFVFGNGLVGINPEADATTYTDALDSFRLSVVGASRGYIDDAQTKQARTIGAVAGYLASLPLGDSATYDNISGFTGLTTVYTPSEAGDLIDEGVMPVTELGGIKIIKDMTTSTDVRFERVYAVEIVDEVTEISHQISQQFIGELNTEDNRRLFLQSHDTSLRQLQNGRPPLLDAFTLNVSEGANPNEVDLEIGIQIVSVIDNINVDIVVGEVVLNGGAS